MYWALLKRRALVGTSRVVVQMRTSVMGGEMCGESCAWDHVEGRLRDTSGPRQKRRRCGMEWRRWMANGIWWSNARAVRGRRWWCFRGNAVADEGPCSYTGARSRRGGQRRAAVASSAQNDRYSGKHHSTGGAGSSWPTPLSAWRYLAVGACFQWPFNPRRAKRADALEASTIEPAALSFIRTCAYVCRPHQAQTPTLKYRRAPRDRNIGLLIMMVCLRSASLVCWRVTQGAHANRLCLSPQLIFGARCRGRFPVHLPLGAPQIPPPPCPPPRLSPAVRTRVLTHASPLTSSPSDPALAASCDKPSLVSCSR
ncbi:hypothetical protein BV25DRAFT_1466222 [Artomyces pyxidatus]|uniref:Uncharacterized protein n=1 Tax=Artomyces pyxidatus TaxID=48021 RepID=A0ACB8SMV3_9AGAM|nr:hypothetical protein BV25DRAFT_1466222 [Artomyces pyxidatus]